MKRNSLYGPEGPCPGKHNKFESWFRMKIRFRIRLRSGETLAEILVSALIFLVIAAVLQGAVSFCTNAQRKSSQIRADSQEICRLLREASLTDSGETAVFSFRASTLDGNQTGTTVLFSIEVGLDTKEVRYEDENGEEQTVIFYVFGMPETGEANTGGESP